MMSLPVCLSGPMFFPGWVYDVTSCLATWSHDSSGECLPTRGCLPTKGDYLPGSMAPPPVLTTSGWRYASYCILVYLLP